MPASLKPPHGSTIIRDLLLPMRESAVYVKGQDSHGPQSLITASAARTRSGTAMLNPASFGLKCG